MMSIELSYYLSMVCLWLQPKLIRNLNELRTDTYQSCCFQIQNGRSTNRYLQFIEQNLSGENIDLKIII